MARRGGPSWAELLLAVPAAGCGLAALVVMAGRGAVDDAVLRGAAAAMLLPTAALMLSAGHALRPLRALTTLVGLAAGVLALHAALSAGGGWRAGRGGGPATAEVLLGLATAAVLGAAAMLTARRDPVSGAGPGWAAVAALAALLAAALPGRWGDGLYAVAVAAAPTALLIAAGAYRPDSPRWSGVVVWAQAALLAGVAYGAVLGLGDSRGWSDPLTLGLGAGVFVLTVATLGRLLERHTLMLSGGGGRPTDVLAGLGPGLARAADARSDLAHLAEGLRESTGMRAVVIAPARSAEARVVAGTPSGPAAEIALRTRRRTVGELLVYGEPARLRRTVEPLEPALSGLVGVSVLLAELNADLTALRARTVSTRRDEQELLHRELGTTLAPVVEEVAADLQRAQELAATDPAAARDLVRTARDRLAWSTAGVRALARALLPAALDHGDLAGALAQLTSGAGGTWQVRAEQGARLDARTQFALYLVAADLLGAAESATADAMVRLDVLVDGATARMRVTVTGPGAARLRDALRVAVESRADSLALAVHSGPDGSLEVEAPAW